MMHLSGDKYAMLCYIMCVEDCIWTFMDVLGIVSCKRCEHVLKAFSKKKQAGLATGNKHRLMKLLSSKTTMSQKHDWKIIQFISLSSEGLQKMFKGQADVNIAILFKIFECPPYHPSKFTPKFNSHFFLLKKKVEPYHFKPQRAFSYVPLANLLGV